MKIWSIDGKLVHKMDNFLGTVTGLCYIPRNKTVWVAGGAPYAWLYDPKSGDNVSDFIGTFQNIEEEKYYLHGLKYFNELSIAVCKYCSYFWRHYIHIYNVERTRLNQ